ncbi:hypothetical protein CASFOL_029987 [Castilleja foliolosa]|uniref:beta-N-acetylhexosaminidase n=1 Tax=Castilleja foliolosa TaxID=1961234 RepID=A0ABD3C9G0_9LAMI
MVVTGGGFQFAGIRMEQAEKRVMGLSLNGVTEVVGVARRFGGGQMVSNYEIDCGSRWVTALAEGDGFRHGGGSGSDQDMLKTLERYQKCNYGAPEPNISAREALDDSGILKDAFLRLIDVVNGAHVIEANTSKIDPSILLRGIHVIVYSPSDELQYGVDESYKLHIPDNGNPIYAHIEAQTVYGALHGLQTFSQVCHYNISSRGILVHQVPLTIFDQPRFSYRGLLIDTSRHYQPLPVIKKVIDSMTYAKLNVLHWHIVDTQSFPLEIPSYPKLWDGSYSASERYTFADATEIVSYAKRRGINVLAEIDVPGHAQSWGVGYPSLWPSRDCKEPLDVSNEFTFKLIVKLRGHATLAASHFLFTFDLVKSNTIEFMTLSGILTAKRVPDSSNGNASDSFLIELNFPVDPLMEYNVVADVSTVSKSLNGASLKEILKTTGDDLLVRISIFTLCCIANFWH